MPGLHVHLKHGIEFDCLDAAPEDSHQGEADGPHDPAQRAAKRRRIETIATQYLRGRAPLILSAGLKGPFKRGWKNPWARPSHGPGLKQNNRERATSTTAAAAQPDRGRKGTRTRKPSPIPSPETSRMVLNLSPAVDPVDEQQDHAEAPLSDSPVQQDDSGGTEFFSVDAGPTIPIDASESNPFWLRRQSSNRVRLSQRQDGNDYSSPTRTGTDSRPIDRSGQIQLAPPKVALTRACSSPIRSNALNTEWQPSASASMVISSPVKPSHAVPMGAGNVSSLKDFRPASPSPGRQFSSNDVTAALSAPSAETTTPLTVTASALTNLLERTTELTPCAELRGAQTGPESSIDDRTTPMTRSKKLSAAEHARTFTPINAISRMAGPNSAYTVHVKDAHPSIVEGHRAATNLALLAVEKARNTQTPREMIHQLAERRAQLTPSSNAKETNEKAKGASFNNQRRRCNAQVTSPTPPSSTGLAYRRVGNEKPKKGTHSTKPRLVTFSSSPPAGDGPCPVLGPPPQKTSPVEESTSARRDIYAVPQSPTEQHSEQQQSFNPSRSSGYSTQAAMMLAQLEFKEGTMLSVASGTPGPWPPPQHGSPQKSHVEESSLAFTPFSEFNAELDNRHPPQRISEEVPISTQELLLAASPFAFSTTKKKSTRAQGSGLRFTVYPSGEQTGYAEQIHGAKSPTPSERIPLRARNSQLSFQSTVSEKGSQEAPLLEPKLTRQDAELPRLDFRSSMDDLGPHGDVEFTDRFLRNVKGMT